MCIKKNNFSFLSFGKRIDVLMSKKNTHTHTQTRTKMIIIEFLQTDK